MGGACMKASEWLDRGMRSSDPIDAFSNLWRAFNNLYFPTEASTERKKILQFLAAGVSEPQAEELLDRNEGAVAYLLSRPVIDMRMNGKDTSGYLEAYHSSESTALKLRQLFMVIYQVRCNLEHGQKSPHEERDVMLCEASVPLVAAVLRLHL